MKNLDECIKWVRSHTPFAIKPVRSKRSLISPFSSGRAFDIVTEELGKELYKELNK